eukprot:3254146-Amphidinium_carterae.1
MITSNTSEPASFARWRDSTNACVDVQLCWHKDMPGGKQPHPKHSNLKTHKPISKFHAVPDVLSEQGQEKIHHHEVECYGICTTSPCCSC